MKFKSIITTLVFLVITMISVAQEADSLSDSQEPDYITDKRDNNTYKTVKIGAQTWMAENLAFKPKGGGYWSYNFDNSLVEKYGYLYAFAVAKTVCPKGWHLPSDNEWRELTKNLGGEALAGKKMKSKTGWRASDSSKGTDESGFMAIPAGFRDGYGVFYSIKEVGYWWSSTASDHSVDFAWLRGMFYDRDYVGRYENWRPSGMSVRCIKNELKKNNQKKEVDEELKDIEDQ